MKPRFPSRVVGLAMAAVLLVAMAALAWYQQTRVTVHAVDGYTMGSTWSVRFSAPARMDDTAIQAQLEQELGGLDLALSGYRNDSALARLNSAPIGQWVEIPPHLANVLQFGLQLWRESGGAFDMTVKPLVNLWGFGAAAPRSSVPTETEIAAARARLGSGSLELAADSRRARRLANIAIDVDGVAPGYAAGVLSNWLTAHGMANHLVEIGGEMRASGHRPDSVGWRVGIESPDKLRGPIERVITVTDAAVTTAGDYRDYFEVDGKRYQHIIDPVTGWPVAHNLAAVTVLAPGQLSADGYATAIMVMGEAKGLAFAQANHLPVLMIVRAGDGSYRESYNALFASYLASEGR